MGELGEAVSEQILERYSHDLERFEREGGYTIAPRVDAVLHGLGFDPVDARTRPLERLSGGERGRVGLARQLVAPSDVLLLDEPTNHLDLETTRWLEEYLKGTDETVVLVSHDRAFLEDVCDHVLHFEAHTGTPYLGGYSAFVEQRADRRLEQQRAFEQQKKTIDKQEDYISAATSRDRTASRPRGAGSFSRACRDSAPPTGGGRYDGAAAGHRRARWRSGRRGREAAARGGRSRADRELQRDRACVATSLDSSGRTARASRRCCAR